MRRGAGLALAGLLLAACGTSPTEAAPGNPDRVGQSPAFVVRGEGEPVTLKAWTFCADSMCADGAPPEDPPSVGRPAAVTVRFSEPGWTLSAEFQTPNQDCVREFSVPLTQTDDGGWVLGPAGPADTYDVTLSARGTGNGGGDAFATFSWTAPARGTIPAPEADLITDFAELSVRNLDRTPKVGRATITITAADGKVTTIRPPAEGLDEEGEPCAADGRILFYAGQTDPTDYGPEPLRYDVRLELDGQSYRAEATAPGDVEQRDGHPRIDLNFDPPLPAFTG